MTNRDAEIAEIKRQCALPPRLATIGCSARPPKLPAQCEIAANSAEWKRYADKIDSFPDKSLEWECYADKVYSLAHDAGVAFEQQTLPALERQARGICENETLFEMQMRGLYYSQWDDGENDPLYGGQVCIYCAGHYDIERKWVRLLGTTKIACSRCVKCFKANPGIVPPTILASCLIGPCLICAKKANAGTVPPTL